MKNLQNIFSGKMLPLAIFLCLASNLSAQIKGNPLDSSTHTVTLKFEASLNDMNKPSIQPPVAPAKVESESVKFEEKEFNPFTKYTPPVPRVKKPEKPVWPSLQNNFIKVGYGRYSTPFIKLYLNSGRSTNGNAGLDFTHLSSSKAQIAFAEFREDYGTVHGEYLLKDQSLGAKFYMYNTSYSYYADTIVEGHAELKDTISQSFLRTKFDAFIMKNRKPGEINYNVPLQFKSWSDKYFNKELQFSLFPSLDWSIAEHFDAGITSAMTFSNAYVDSVSQGRFFLDLTPTVTMHFDKLSLTAGLKIASFTDSSNTFRGLPILQAEYHLVPGKLNLKAGLRGDMINNQFYELTTVNKYINLKNSIKPTIENLNLYAAAEGNFAKYFNFSAKVYYKSIENMPLFYLPEGRGNGLFNVIYDSSFKETGTELNLNFSKDDKIKAGVKANVRNFKTSNDSMLYNFCIPSTKVDFWGSYNFGNKVWVTAEIYLYGKRTMTLDSLFAPVQQDMQADINLHAEYRFSKRISIFLDLNNLLGNKYYRWYNYLERPFDIKGGVTASF